MAIELFRRGLSDHRRSLLGWCIGITLYVVLLAAIFPSIQGSPDISNLLENYPEALKSLFGLTGAVDITRGAGFVDTLDANAVNLHSRVIETLNNPNSAMPSLHVSYALVVATAGVLLVRRRWMKLLWMLYPVLVTFSIVATGNHFVLDAAGGALALLATPCVTLVVGSVTAVCNRARIGRPAQSAGCLE